MTDISPETRRILQAKSFAEFFAGIGLVRAGLERQGWSIAMANDIDPKKYEMYKSHFTDAEEHFILNDIYKLDVTARQSVTLATASFPCKDLSLAGSREGLNGVHSSAFWGFVRILEQWQQNKPPLVMIENVPGLLNSNKGKDFEQALLALNKLGYSTDTFLLDAANFVPQSRERLFIIGLAKQIFPARNPNEALFGLQSSIRPPTIASFILKHPHIQWNIRHLPPLPTREQSLEDIIEDLPEDHPLWWSQSRAQYLLHQMSPRHQMIANKMIADNRWSYGTVFRRMRNHKSTAELRVDGIAGCLRTPAGGSAKQILFKAGHGRYFARLISSREAARLMGIGEYTLTVPLDQALLGFGDAVCVTVIEWIAENYFHPVIEACIAPPTQEVAFVGAE